VVKRLAKGAAWLLGAAVLLLAAWFGINATDEALSEEARAAMNVSPLPPPDRDNGFLDFLVLAAPAEVPTYEAALDRLSAINNQTGGDFPPAPWPPFRADARLQRCTFGTARGESAEMPGCVQMALEPWVPGVLEAHAVLLGRYLSMREKPRFINLIDPRSPENPLPAYQEMLEGQRVVLIGAARRFHAGDRAGAVREVEREAAFYRRMAADATLLIDKMISFAALDRVALFTAELARRAPRGEAPLWRRLEALAAPLTKAELDVVPSLRRDFANTVRWMQTRRYVRLSESTWEMFREFDGRARPWWEPVSPYLYRPHQTVNWFAARCPFFLAAAEQPSSELFRAAEAARARARALDPAPVARMILNPVGWNHPLISNCDFTDYIARAHGRAGVQTLVQLLVRLHARGITRSQDVAATLAGPLGRAHADPFTGEPMRYDPATQTIGFDAEAKHISGAARHMRKRYGRMALRL
jgi:hypothetical protein